MDVQGGPARAVVVERVGLDVGDGGGFLGQQVRRRGGRGARVYPGIEGDDHEGVVQLGVSEQVVQRHRYRIAIGRAAPARGFVPILEGPPSGGHFTRTDRGDR